MELIIASQNKNKISEISEALSGIKVQGLSEDLFPEELVEDGSTLEENALQKARQVYAKTQTNCFADDTGLEVTALNNRPGVYSARYAGEQKNAEDNMDKLLEELAGIEDRSARFRTVIALIWEGQEYLFEGICEGRISLERAGNQGFGYDPVFIPENENRSFAQMDQSEKNKLSHRGLAVSKLIDFLKTKVQL